MEERKKKENSSFCGAGEKDGKYLKKGCMWRTIKTAKEKEENIWHLENKN